MAEGDERCLIIAGVQRSKGFALVAGDVIAGGDFAGDIQRDLNLAGDAAAGMGQHGCILAARWRLEADKAVPPLAGVIVGGQRLAVGAKNDQQGVGIHVALNADGCYNHLLAGAGAEGEEIDMAVIHGHFHAAHPV